MVEGIRNERSGISWDEGYTADAMQASLLRWELQSCLRLLVSFLSAAGFPCLSFDNMTQKSNITLDFGP